MSGNMKGESSKSIKNKKQKRDEGEERMEMELSLGLSTNGLFGVDPMKKLVKTTSVPELSSTEVKRNNYYNYAGTAFAQMSYVMIAHALSIRTEENKKKRKFMQTIRRMEAKRKRSEKQQRNQNPLLSGQENVLAPIPYVSQALPGPSNYRAVVPPPRPIPTPPRPVPIPPRATSGSKNVRKLPPLPQPSAAQRTDQLAGAAQRTGQVAIQNGPEMKPDNTNVFRQILMRALKDMPHVSTKVEGPNERKIEGFLYNYKKGEEVSIICTCHGRFFSPAQFVEHGGARNVENPLRHIVVKPSRTS